MALIYNKQAVVFNFCFEETWEFDGRNLKTGKILFSRKQVHCQFVSAPYMAGHITTGGCLEKPHVQKAWGSLNQQVTEREVCSPTKSSVMPLLWMFLPVQQAVCCDIYWRSILKKSAVPGSTGWQWAARVGDSSRQNAGEALVQEWSKWWTGRRRAEESCATQ